MAEGSTEALKSYPEMAEALGVAQSTLEYWVSRREVPFYRIGRLVRFKPSEMNDWVESRRVEVIAR